MLRWAPEASSAVTVQKSSESTILLVPGTVRPGKAMPACAVSCLNSPKLQRMRSITWTPISPLAPRPSRSRGDGGYGCPRDMRFLVRPARYHPAHVDVEDAAEDARLGHGVQALH